MAMHDYLNKRVSFLQAFAPQAVTAVTSGTAINNLDGDGTGFVINLGAFAGTTPTATLTMQESDDNVTWTDVDPSQIVGDVIPQLTPAYCAANPIVKRSYNGYKKYSRLRVSAIAGAGASLQIAAQAVQHPNIWAPQL